MNKNILEKLKKIFKKEGFYISLFVAICVIATMGTLSYKMFINRNADINNPIKDNASINVDKNQNLEIVNNEMQNAERVEKESNNNSENNAENKPEDTVVSNTQSVKFMNPVEGAESRTYTYPKPVQVEENLFRTIKGINIESKIGTEVRAAAEGIVSKVENCGVEEGVIVEIKHTNGLKTRYGNLDEKVLVNEGQKVNAGTVVGTIGSTAKVFDQKTFGQFLNLQVIDANGNQVNPENYFQLSNK